MLQRANEAFARAVASAQTDDADAYYAYATFLMKNQSNDRDSRLMAKRFFIRAIEIDRCHVLALDELAAIHETEANLEEAERLWVEALDVEPTMAPSQADFVSLLERVRTRCYTAEEVVNRDEDGGALAARSLVLHQQLRKYATLKAMYVSRMEVAGGDDFALPPATSGGTASQQDRQVESEGGVFLRHSRAYLNAFRDQFKDNSRNAYRS
jgi:tetratricopeptide (TPR) repeat protein